MWMKTKKNITLKMLVFCNGDGFAWYKMWVWAYSTHTHTHTHTRLHACMCARTSLGIESHSFIHSFIRWLVRCRCRSIYLFVLRTHITQQMLSGLTKPLWHMHAQFLLFFRSKTTTIDNNNLHTHALAHDMRTFHIERQRTKTVHYNHISIVERSVISLFRTHRSWVANRKEKKRNNRRA